MEESAAIVFAFLERLIADRAAGRSLELGEYQALFPGHDDVIAEQHARYERGDAWAQPALERVGHFRIVRELGRGG